jgi:glucose/arabinose dehydrogenase
MKNILAAIGTVLSMALLVPAAVSAQAQLPQGFVEEPYARGLNGAATMTVAPDGRIFVAERVMGNIRVISHGRLEAAPYYTFTDVLGSPGEDPNRFGFEDFHGGLLGLAFDPQFPINQRLYAYYTASASDGAFNRIIRLTGHEAGASPVAILDKIPRGTVHQSGRLEFGMDGRLFVTVGDLDTPEEAQNPGAIAGKVLRLLPDGTASPDNPFVNRAGYLPAVFAMGIRSGFGLAVDSVTGRLYETENGDFTTDELNLVSPGANLGHPSCQGACGAAAYKDPLYTFPIEVVPTGIAYYDGDTFPSQYQGNLFVASFLTGAIYRFELDSTGTGVSKVSVFYDGEGAIYDLRVGRDGALYYLHGPLGTGGAEEVRRIRFESGGVPTLSITGNSRSGEWIVLGVTGAPRAAVDLVWAFSRSPTAVQTPEGLLELGEPRFRSPLGQLGVDGRLAVPFPLLPGMSGRVWYLQAAVESGGSFRLTPLVAQTILEELGN